MRIEEAHVGYDMFVKYLLFRSLSVYENVLTSNDGKANAGITSGFHSPPPNQMCMFSFFLLVFSCFCCQKADYDYEVIHCQVQGLRATSAEELRKSLP